MATRSVLQLLWPTGRWHGLVNHAGGCGGGLADTTLSTAPLQVKRGKLNDEKAQKRNGDPTHLFFCPTVGTPGGTVASLESTAVGVAGLAALCTPFSDGDRLPLHNSVAADRDRCALSHVYGNTGCSTNHAAGHNCTNHTAAPRSASLPAALYLLTSDGQVARLDADGSTITVLTNEPEPIVAFDVSPTDGRLAYHVGEALFEILPDGTRIHKAQSTDDFGSRPLFSPDGAAIYFYQKDVGIQRIPVGVDAVAALVLAEAAPTVTESDGIERVTLPRQHYPRDWSPDGRYLVLEVCDTHCGLIELFDLQTQRLIPLTINDPVDQREVAPLGQWSWPPQAAAPLITTLGLMGPRSAVMRADPLTGDVTVLFKQLTIGATTYELPHMINTWPVDNETFFVVGAPAIGAQTHLYQVDQQGIATPLMAVGGAFPDVGDGLLWANDGSGLVYSAQEGMEWLLTDGNAPVRLPIAGRSLRWGP